MKKQIIYFLIVLTTLVAFPQISSAQSANRSGFILEFKGGRVFGTVCDTGDFDADKAAGKPAFRKSGGAYGGMNIGYRWRTSNHLSMEAKMLVADNLSAAKEMVTFGLVPGVRYVTNEISGNTSMYVGFNIGVGITPFVYELGASILPGISFGFNLSNMLNLGVFIDYNLCFVGDYDIDKDIPSYDGGYMYYAPLKSNILAGVILGFRF